MSKADETARVNDWVNNSPVVTEPVPTNAISVNLPPTEQVVLPATTVNSVVNPVTGFASVHTTTAPVASTSYNASAMQLQNKTVPQPTMAAAHLPVNHPVTSTPTTNVTALPILPTVMDPWVNRSSDGSRLASAVLSRIPCSFVCLSGSWELNGVRGLLLGSCSILGTCVSSEIGLLKCVRCKSLLSEVVIVCFVPDTAIFDLSEYTQSNSSFGNFFSRKRNG